MRTYFSSAPSTGGGGSTILSAVLEADFSRTNDTPTNVTDLTLTLPVGWYRITGRGKVTSGTVGWSWNIFDGGTAVITDGYATTIIGKGVAVAVEADSFSYVADSAVQFYFDATVEVGTAGTLVPQFFQSVTDVDPAVLAKYTVIQAFDITPAP